jgi:hypothetical protein
MFIRLRAGAGGSAASLAASLLMACSPVLDWRDVRPADTGLQLLLPCKAQAQARQLLLSGQSVKLSMWACSAGGQTWALAFADVQDPARAAPALAELLTAAASNLGSAGGQPLPLKVPGATPHPGSQRLAISGRLPNGQAVQEQVAVFVLGTRVFQATVLGENLNAEAVETFFGSLRVVL